MPQPTAPMPLVVDYFVNEQLAPVDLDVQPELAPKYHILPGLHRHDVDMPDPALSCVLLDVQLTPLAWSMSVLAMSVHVLYACCSCVDVECRRQCSAVAALCCTRARMHGALWVSG